MVAVTSMSRVAGMALVSGVAVVAIVAGMGIVRVVTGRVVGTRVRIVHGVVVLRLVAVVLVVVLVMTGVAVARCASAAVVIVVVGTVLVAHTGLVSADVLRRLSVRAGSVCGFDFAFDDPLVVGHSHPVRLVVDDINGLVS